MPHMGMIMGMVVGLLCPVLPTPHSALLREEPLRLRFVRHHCLARHRRFGIVWVCLGVLPWTLKVVPLGFGDPFLGHISSILRRTFEGYNLRGTSLHPLSLGLRLQKTLKP